MFDPITYILAKKGGGGSSDADHIAYDPESEHPTGTVGAELSQLSADIVDLQNELSGLNTLLGSGDYT